MNRSVKVLVLFLALSPLGSFNSSAEVVTIESTGIGRSRPEAVTQGLVEAVQRVTGVRIDQAAITGLNQTVVQLDGNLNRSNPVNASGENLSSTLKVSGGMDVVQSQSGGAVKTYSVLSSTVDDRGYTTVRLNVEVEKFRSVMPETAKRVRIIVATFQGLTPDYAALLQDRLKVYFVQARRFSVLDRAENAQYASEMNLVTSEAASLTERVRFGQVLGADFILVGKVAVTRRIVDVLNPISMEKTKREVFDAETTYSLIEIATRQIQWSNIIKAPAIDPSFEALSRVIGTQVSETLFPLRVLTSDDPANLIINQGGQSAASGERFRLVELGADLRDPDTKESLGRRETELGIVEITRVTPTISFAKIVAGSIKKSDDLILRRANAEPKVPPAAPNPGTRSKAFD
jgi:hypothetical protein